MGQNLVPRVTGPVPEDFILDVRVAREIFGQHVDVLPAYRDLECGEIQLQDPAMQDHTFEKEGELTEYMKHEQEELKELGSSPWDGRRGLIPAVRVKHETEEHYWWEPIPRYSKSLDEAWKVIMKAREWPHNEFFDRIDMRNLLLNSTEVARNICELALELNPNK